MKLEKLINTLSLFFLSPPRCLSPFSVQHLAGLLRVPTDKAELSHCSQYLAYADGTEYFMFIAQT